MCRRATVVSSRSVVGLDSYDEETEGPYYTHLGVGPSVAAIRQMMEDRSLIILLT